MTRKKLLHNLAGASCTEDFTFPIHILFQHSSSFGPSKSNRPEYNQTSATLSADVLFFLRDTVDIVGRFYGNE